MRLRDLFATFALLLGLVACGGDDGSPGLASIAISGVPAEAMMPGQSAQLKAVGTHSDGSTADLTTSASWTSTAPTVLTVSTSGFVTAVAPGNATVVVSAAGAFGSAVIQVLAAPTWATVDRSGRTYRMDYALDAQRRIKTYELFDEELGRTVQQCSGDLSASWECRDELSAPSITASATVDAQGRPSSYSFNSLQVPLGENIAYSYNAAGRLIQVDRSRWTTMGDSITRNSTLAYDAAGRLTSIGLRVNSLKNPQQRSDSTYTVVSTGSRPTELLLTRRDYVFGFPIKPDYTIRLTYDDSGRITERVVIEVAATGERIASRLGFQIDSRGFLVRQLLQQYQYDPGPPPVIETETTWCLEWLPYADSALASEGYCPSWPSPSGIRYPYGRMPTQPLTVFPAYAASALDLLCLIADECADPNRLRPGP